MSHREVFWEVGIAAVAGFLLVRAMLRFLRGVAALLSLMFSGVESLCRLGVLGWGAYDQRRIDRLLRRHPHLGRPAGLPGPARSGRALYDPAQSGGSAAQGPAPEGPP